MECDVGVEFTRVVDGGICREAATFPRIGDFGVEGVIVVDAKTDEIAGVGRRRSAGGVAARADAGVEFAVAVFDALPLIFGAVVGCD